MREGERQADDDRSTKNVESISNRLHTDEIIIIKRQSCLGNIIHNISVDGHQRERVRIVQNVVVANLLEGKYNIWEKQSETRARAEDESTPAHTHGVYRVYIDRLDFEFFRSHTAVRGGGRERENERTNKTSTLRDVIEKENNQN